MDPVSSSLLPPLTVVARQTFAGVISLLNDYRLSQGKSSLGFLNPLLYSTGLAGLNDITSGSNPGCGTNGFTAVAGWDPVRAALLVSNVLSFTNAFCSAAALIIYRSPVWVRPTSWR